MHSAGHRALATMIVLATGGLGGCFSPSIDDGAFACGSGAHVCPNDFTCGSDNRCHKGTTVVTDGGVDFMDAKLGADGSGGAPHLTVDPVMVDLSDVVFFTQAPAQHVTVSNTGTGGSGNATLTPRGTDAIDFVISNDTCSGHGLVPNASCGFDVTNAQTTPEHMHSATITLAATPGASIDIPVKVNVTSVMRVAPSTQAFPNTAVGNSSLVQRFTFTYSGTLRTDMVSVALGGGNPGDFLIPSTGGDNCSGTSLQPGTTCTVDVRFAPVTSGLKAADLTITAKPGGSATATLSGMTM